MPVIRALFTLLTVAFAVMVGLFILALSLTTFLVRRLFGRPAARPQFTRFTMQRPPPSPAPARPGVPRTRNDDVIDVEATPVKD